MKKLSQWSLFLSALILISTGCNSSKKITEGSSSAPVAATSNAIVQMRLYRGPYAPNLPYTPYSTNFHLQICSGQRTSCKDYDLTSDANGIAQIYLRAGAYIITDPNPIVNGVPHLILAADDFRVFPAPANSVYVHNVFYDDGNH